MPCQIVRLMQRRQRYEVLQRRQDVVIDEDRLLEARAAVNHPVTDRHRQLPGQGLAEPGLQDRDRRRGVRHIRRCEGPLGKHLPVGLLDQHLWLDPDALDLPLEAPAQILAVDRKELELEAGRSRVEDQNRLRHR